MADNNSVMEKDSNSTSFSQNLEDEYQEAVQNGFAGTKQEYLQCRDYIK